MQQYLTQNKGLKENVNSGKCLGFQTQTPGNMNEKATYFFREPNHTLKYKFV